MPQAVYNHDEVKNFLSTELHSKTRKNSLSLSRQSNQASWKILNKFVYNLGGDQAHRYLEGLKRTSKDHVTYFIFAHAC